MVRINDKVELNKTLLYDADLEAEILYLGGIPNQTPNRVKRQLGIQFESYNDTNMHFKGVIQDVRVSIFDKKCTNKT